MKQPVHTSSLLVRAAGLALLCALSWGAVSTAQAASPYDVTAQKLSGIQKGSSAGLSGLGLFDTSRLRFNHAMSFNYTSGTQGSAGFGLWQGRLAYQVSNPLRVSVDVGAVLNPMGGGPVLSEQSFFLGGFNLEYQPSTKFKINISYVNTPPAAVLPGRYTYLGFPGWSNPGMPQ